MSESPSGKWLIVAYDLPNEPSKLRVKVWRNFKKNEALYPSVSLCILPDTQQVRKWINQVRPDLYKNGSVLVLSANPLEKMDGEQLIKMFQEDRKKQYEELYEECREFLDEIKENLGKKKITYEETDELEQALEGLEKWYNDIRQKGYGRQEDMAKVDRVMKECRKQLANFSEKAQPKKIND
jgi:molecular chaperone DnaK (HSP70)